MAFVLGISSPPLSKKKTINNLLEFQKVCARWVPQKLTDEMKAERIKSFKGNSEEEGEGFLQQIVRGDKIWGQHHDPENERQSMEYITTKDHKHQRNSEPKPLLQKLCWLYSRTLKVLCSLTSWKSTTVNSEYYIEILKNKKIHHEEGGRNPCFNKTMLGLTQVPP
jgi:hypothetical protein